MGHPWSSWKRQAITWVWIFVGWVCLAALLTGCLGHPCPSDVPEQLAQLSAANGIFYLGEDGGQVVSAFRASDGTRLWIEQRSERFRGASDGMVFLTNSVVLEAVRDQDKTLLWQDAPIQFTALAVDQGMVYLASNEAITALRESSGTLLWHKASPFAPLQLKAMGGSIYLLGSQSIAALRERDGTAIWQTNNDMGASATLEIDANSVYLASAQQAQVLRASDGTLLWQTSANTWGHFMAAGGGVAYFVDNSPTLEDQKRLNALRGSDGALLWQAQPDGAIASVLPLGESVIFFGLNSGRMSAVRASDGSSLWQQQLQLSTGRNVVLAATNGTIGAGTVYWVHEGTCNSTTFPPTAASVRVTDGAVLWYAQSNYA